MQYQAEGFVSDEDCKVEKLTQFITATALKTISKTNDV
jgi:hypothetical protein